MARVNSPFSRNIVEDEFDDANVQSDDDMGLNVVMGEDVVEWMGGDGGNGGGDGNGVIALVSKIWVRSMGLVHANSK